MMMPRRDDAGCGMDGRFHGLLATCSLVALVLVLRGDSCLAVGYQHAVLYCQLSDVLSTVTLSADCHRHNNSGVRTPLRNPGNPESRTVSSSRLYTVYVILSTNCQHSRRDCLHHSIFSRRQHKQPKHDVTIVVDSGVSCHRVWRLAWQWILYSSIIGACKSCALPSNFR